MESKENFSAVQGLHLANHIFADIHPHGQHISRVIRDALDQSFVSPAPDISRDSVAAESALPLEPRLSSGTDMEQSTDKLAAIDVTKLVSGEELLLDEDQEARGTNTETGPLEEETVMEENVIYDPHSGKSKFPISLEDGAENNGYFEISHPQQAETIDAFGQYLREIKQFPPLSALEQQQLAIRVERGRVELLKPENERDNLILEEGKAARRKLIESTLPMVVSIAKKYVNQKHTLQDLVQEGNIGLLRTLETFDYTREIKFSSYAYKGVELAISHAAMEGGRLIRIPLYMEIYIKKLMRISGVLAQELGRDPTPEEIAERMEISVGEVTDIITYSQQEPVSTETPIGEDDESVLGDMLEDSTTLSPHEEVIHGMLKDALAGVLDTLKLHEKHVIELRYGLHDGFSRSLEETGKALHRTREAIRQTEIKALRKLRHPSITRLLKEYAD